jgi:hypothetical protein
MQINFVVLYLTVGLLVFCILLSGFLLDDSVSKTDVTSWLVVIFGTIFWLLIIPFSFVEVTCKLLKLKDRAQDQSHPKRNLS